jgi:7-cyano-7-deazaguanine synthase in queuosine biosynthesis
MNTLLNLSGGIDSAAVLYDYAVRGEPLLVNHIIISNFEQRIRHEHSAVRDLLRFVKNAFPNFSYQLIESKFNAGNTGYYTLDKLTVGFVTGMVLNNPAYKNVKNIIISSNADDIARVNYYEASEARRKAIIMAMCQRDDLNYIYPISQESKEQLCQRLPPDYLALTWFCRKPQADGNTCGRCVPCKAVKRSGVVWR